MAIARLKRAFRAGLGERGGIIHSLGILVGGTAFAQALAVLALPLLTRLYSPAEFSVLAVFAAVLGILSVVACLRFEIAVPIPEDERDAVNLFALALGFGLAVSAFVGLVVLAIGDQLISWLGIQVLAPYLWMIPFGMAIASAYAGTQYWSTRKKKFSRIAKTRMLQALGGVTVQAGAGIAGLGSVGLLIGHMITCGAGFIGLARDAMKHDRQLLRAVNLTRMRHLFHEYSRFPKYSTLEAFANTAGIQVPLILIAGMALGPEAGFLALAMRVMGAPMGLVGGSLAQIYLSQAPEELRAGTLGQFTTRILTGLLKTGVGPLLFMGVVAVPMAEVVFGSDWARVGELIAWMTPWFIFQFLASPVSMAMHVTGRQGQILSLTIFGLVLRVGAVWLASNVNREMLAEAYAVAGGVFYLVCASVFYRSAKVELSSILYSLRQTLIPIMTWSALGAAISVLTRIVFEI